jgi:small subunit ribosomal protein S20
LTAALQAVKSLHACCNKSRGDFQKEILMANHPSALKRMRQNEKKRLRNMSYKSKVKTTVKKYLKAVEEKTSEASALLNETMSLLSKGVTKGIFHKNTASRSISRLSRKLTV